MSNRIGIVTISYNQARFLEEAIESVTVKDPERLRYVIVDPGSTDGSRDIIARNHDRFSKVILEPDSGPADGLNKGFAACSADIYGYINADDRFMPGTLDWVLSFFETHPDVEAICGAVSVLNEDGTERFRRRVPWRFDAQGVLDGTALYIQQGTFFRASAWHKVNGFHPENHTSWDSELALDMILAGVALVPVAKCLGCFRWYDTSVSGQLRAQDPIQIERHRRDRNRMRVKIGNMGYHPRSGIRLALAKLDFRFNPIRRAKEMLLR